ANKSNLGATFILPNFPSTPKLTRLDLHIAIRNLPQTSPSSAIAKRETDMAAKQIPISNPPPLPSHLPDSVLDLAVQIEKRPLPQDVRESLQSFQRAGCYIAGAMIFLRDNVLLESDLQLDHVKPRLLGHWGTCPGLILVWSHLNLLIRNHDLDMIYVIGPGHGAPAALAALWLEGSLEQFYPGEYDRNADGLRNLITRFSVPGGFPSHINAETPGSIHEGGELGYALAVSFGAVMDKPDLIVTCVVGDGEAETGPTATAWHAIKYLDPKESGAVIPILHINGFKISERTIFGCMDDKEIVSLFSGYGYQVRIVEDLDNINDDLHNSLEWALAEVKKIQHAARSGKPIEKPRWPMIALRTPKGWGGPKEVDGKIIEGSFHSHQVPLAKANSDESQLKALQDWLSSYNISKLIQDGKPTDTILRTIPTNDEKKLGQLKTTYDPYIELKTTDWQEFAVEKGTDQSCMQVTGKYLDRIFQENPTNIRLFSPDELESNKLNAILDHTQRNFQWDQYSRANGGRVIEVLSEHCCQGFMQGYTLTGRTALFPSYESFLGIVHTMMVQYQKFVKIAREVKWRGDLSSINYIETSTWARQEHNGFSHQNPSFIGAVLNLKAEAARVYLPPDANCFLSTIRHCLRSKSYTNLVIGSKQPTAVYLSPSEADEHCRLGASIWHFASTPDPSGQASSTPNPDVVLVGIGVEVTFEVIKAAELLRTLCPELRIRVINVTDLMILFAESAHPHALSKERFVELFTKDKPVLFNYHGYKTELQGVLFGREGVARMTVRGYEEEGSTTTPFDMMARNGVSRFDVAQWALKKGAVGNEEVKGGWRGS
ncbi:XFP N-terminal domain-containing protein, partial [Bombardia bombarda]